MNKSNDFYNIPNTSIYIGYHDKELKHRNKIRKLNNDNKESSINTLNLIKLKSDYLDMRTFYYDSYTKKLYVHNNGTTSLNVIEDMHILQLNNLIS